MYEENEEIRSTIGEMTWVFLAAWTYRSLQYWPPNGSWEKTDPSDTALPLVTRFLNKMADNSRFPHPAKRYSLYSASPKEVVSFSLQILPNRHHRRRRGREPLFLSDFSGFFSFFSHSPLVSTTEPRNLPPGPVTSLEPSFCPNEKTLSEIKISNYGLPVKCC